VKLLFISLLLPLALVAQEPAKKKPFVPVKRPTYTKSKHEGSKIESAILSPVQTPKPIEREPDSESEPAAAPEPQPAAELKPLAAKRADKKWILAANYALIDAFFSANRGFSAGYALSPANTLEFDYAWGSNDLDWIDEKQGQASTQRYMLLWRSYGQRGSFNLQYGLSLNKYKVNLSDQALMSVPAHLRNEASTMDIETLNLGFGLGNRWQTQSGLVFSFDWLQTHLPIHTLKKRATYADATISGIDRDDANKITRSMTKLPRFVILKIELGITF
jgi:hypothetical protein